MRAASPPESEIPGRQGKGNNTKRRRKKQERTEQEVSHSHFISQSWRCHHMNICHGLEVTRETLNSDDNEGEGIAQICIPQ